MTRFEDLQELWQGQPGPAVASADIAALTRSLHIYGQRQKWVFGGKLLAVSSILGWSLARCHRPNQIAGLVLVGVAAAMLLTVELRNQRRISKLDFTAPSLPFVRGAIATLKGQINPFRRVYWLFMATVVLSMNLVLGSAPPIWVRLIASSLPFGGVELGLWVRRKRLADECRPLLQQLSAMQAALEERCE
jgi:hypothetical protein